MAKRLSYPEMAAEVMDIIIDDPSFGYSQPNRAGDGTIKMLRLSDGTEVRVRGGDKDCSELIRTCYAAVGILEFDYWTSYTWTQNEEEVLTSHGFVEVDKWSARRGDVLWRRGHTEMHLGNGMCGGARGDEYGGITGPNPGDQTGYEISRSAYDASRWTKVWRYAGPGRPDLEPIPEQVPGDAKNDFGVRYESHCQTAGWLPQVHDGQASGTVGYAKRLEALRIEFPKGVRADVIAHLQGIGSVYYEDVNRDTLIGTEGEQRRLEAIRIRVKSLPANLKGKSIRVQPHLQGHGWVDAVGDDKWAGTMGEARRLEAVRVWFQ